MVLSWTFQVQIRLHDIKCQSDAINFLLMFFLKWKLYDAPFGIPCNLNTCTFQVTQDHRNFHNLAELLMIVSKKTCLTDGQCMLAAEQQLCLRKASNSTKYLAFLILLRNWNKCTLEDNLQKYTCSNNKMEGCDVRHCTKWCCADTLYGEYVSIYFAKQQ